MVWWWWVVWCGVGCVPGDVGCVCVGRGRGGGKGEERGGRGVWVVVVQTIQERTRVCPGVYLRASIGDALGSQRPGRLRHPTSRVLVKQGSENQPETGAAFRTLLWAHPTGTGKRMYCLDGDEHGC